MKVFNYGSLREACLVWQNRKPLVIGVVGLIAYILFIQIGTDRGRGDPYYPLSRWKLFSGTVGLVTQFEVEIIELGGRVLEPPTSVTKLGILQWNVGGPPGLSQLFSDWGSAIKAAKLDRSERLREIFENSYLPLGKIRYQLVRLQYVPVARLGSSSSAERVVVGEYTRN
jgi:hypothetical protein